MAESGSGWRGLLIVGVIVVIFGMAVKSFQHPETAPAEQAQDHPAEVEKKRLAARTPHEVAVDGTRLAKFSWHKGGFGSIMLASFTIRNDSPYDVKDLDIKCQHAAPSGTVIDSNEQTLYEIVKAHKTRTVREVNMGFIVSQVAQSSCGIVGLSLVTEP